MNASGLVDPSKAEVSHRGASVGEAELQDCKRRRLGRLEATRTLLQVISF